MLAVSELSLVLPRKLLRILRIGFSVYDREFAESGQSVAVIEPGVSSGDPSIENSTDAMPTQSPVARLQAVSKALEGQLANWQGG